MTKCRVDTSTNTQYCRLIPVPLVHSMITLESLGERQCVSCCTRTRTGTRSGTRTGTAEMGQLPYLFFCSILFGERESQGYYGTYHNLHTAFILSEDVVLNCGMNPDPAQRMYADIDTLTSCSLYCTRSDASCVSYCIHYWYLLHRYPAYLYRRRRRRRRP